MGYVVKSRLIYMLHWERLSVLKTRKHQTENGHASSLQKRFFVSWTITVPAMSRSWRYAFLSSRKVTSLLAEIINYYWIAPNLSVTSLLLISSKSKLLLKSETGREVLWQTPEDRNKRMTDCTFHHQEFVDTSV